MIESEFAAKVVQLHALSAELAAAAVGLSGVVAVALLPEVLAGNRQGDLACVRLIERADRSGEYAVDGAASVSAFVRRTANESSGWATKRVQVGRALADSLPATSAAWERGELGLEHANVIDRATKKLTDPALVAELDVYLAQLAAMLTPQELAAASEDLRSQAAPEETEAENAKKRAGQTLHLSQTSDGMWRLDGWLDAEAGLIVSTAIAGFQRKAVPHGDLLTESVGRRRADALVDICRQGVTHATDCDSQGMAKATIVVGLTHQQLLDGLGVANVSGGGNIPAGVARRMACDANILPVVYGGDSQPLDYGRTMRTFTDKLKRAMNLRDGGCTWGCCDRPPAMTEAHHRREWVRDLGPTSEENGDSLCVFHHHLVHEGGWAMTIGDDPARTPWFHPPDGKPPLKGQRRPLLHRYQNSNGHPSDHPKRS